MATRWPSACSARTTAPASAGFSPCTTASGLPFGVTFIAPGGHDAALAAGITRLRPVVMTALAMIIGMLPMSLGLGEGGEQNAPLGRAVIGGLIVATFTTLFFVPVVYSVLTEKQKPKPIDPDLVDPEDERHQQALHAGASS